MNKWDGVGIHDGGDRRSFWKKRIDGDEGLLIQLKPTAEYSSATDALISVDNVRTAWRNGGTIEVIALLGDKVVGKQSYNLNARQEQLNFSSEKPFDSIQLRPKNRRTAFTWREIELSTL